MTDFEAQVKERREALRALAREHMDAVMKAGA